MLLDTPLLATTSLEVDTLLSATTSLDTPLSATTSQDTPLLAIMLLCQRKCSTMESKVKRSSCRLSLFNFGLMDLRLEV